METKKLEIVDNEILSLNKNGKLHIKRNQIIDFITPITNQIIWSVNNNDFSDLKASINNFFEVLSEDTYTYCKKLDSSYNEYFFQCRDIKIQIISALRSIISNPGNNSNALNNILGLLEQNKKQLNYFATLSTLHNDRNNILISNRRHGWIKMGWNKFGKSLQITKDISATIFSNFGFGSSSYFYILIYYKDIPITTFTDYIKYEFVKSFEVIRYTRKYYYYDFKKDEFGNISKTVSLDYKGWENLMSYILYLSNIPEVNKERYFLDYINNEFTIMVNKLDELINSKEYVFYKNVQDDGNDGVINEIFYSVGLKERLLSYKSERIFGTLDFFSIFNNTFLIENKSSIDKLFNFYEMQFPFLKKERVELNQLIPNYEKKIDEYKKLLDDFIDKNAMIYSLLKSNRNVDEFNDVERNIYDDYYNKKNRLFNAEEGLRNLHFTIMRVERYIEDYFKLIDSFQK